VLRKGGVPRSPPSPMTRGDFPLSAVHGDWAKLEAAGIPLQKSEVDGPHDGTSDDWNELLLPKIAGWKAP
jgi:hypothetical protein